MQCMWTPKPDLTLYSLLNILKTLAAMYVSMILQYEGWMSGCPTLPPGQYLLSRYRNTTITYTTVNTYKK